MITDWICVASSRVGERTRAAVGVIRLDPQMNKFDDAHSASTLGFPDRGIDHLKDADREGSRLAGSGLSLRNRVTAFADLDDGARLNS